MDYAKLGKHIRQERRAHRLTQAELAEEIGLSMSFLGHIERGSRVPSLETLVAIANRLRVSVDYLLSDSLEPISARSLGGALSPSQHRVLREIFDKMNEQIERWE